jgi:putative ABC transport system permease protein
LMVVAALPWVNRLTGEDLQPGLLTTSRLGLAAALLPLLTGLLGGSYPALFLSNFKPASVLKGAVHRAGPRHALIRSGLVVFQFTVSIALLVGTLVVARQLAFARSRDIGLSRENVLVVNNTQRLNAGSREVFRQQLLQMPEVIRAGASTDLPARNSFGDLYVPEAGNDGRPVIKDLALASYMVDDDFVPTLEIRIKEGRNFSRDFPSDSAAVILNETAARVIGWEHPVGQYLHYPGNANQRFQVIGVMQDFHTESFRAAVQPFALFHQSSKTYDIPGSCLAVRLRAGQEKKFLAKAEPLWKAAAPGLPFDYSFLDADFDALYRSEAKVGRILTALAGLSIFIGCLGLFGLITFAAEQRTREIGIRKVLGASVSGLVALLARDFLKLVFLAILIATPVAWYVMGKWLQDFEYRIELSWWMFAAAGALALGIALLTVSFQSVKAALANPVRSLSSE